MRHDHAYLIGKALVLVAVLILVGCTELYKYFAPHVEHWIGEAFTRLAYEGREISYNGFRLLVWSGIAAVAVVTVAMITSVGVLVYKSYQTRRLRA